MIDVLKGFVPAMGAGVFNGVVSRTPEAPEALCWMGVSALAIAGHMFPVWLKFKGGKGVATGLGALAGVWPVMTVAAALALVVWVVSAKATKYVGVSSCLAALSMPVGVVGGVWAVTRGERLVQGAWPYLVVATCLAALVIYKHRGNIARTLNGTEARIGKRVEIEGR